MAMTGSPTTRAAEDPSAAGARSPAPSTRMTARSAEGSLPTREASNVPPSKVRTRIPPDWAMTWALVMIRPSSDRITPVPAAVEHAVAGDAAGLDGHDRLLDLVEDGLHVHAALRGADRGPGGVVAAVVARHQHRRGHGGGHQRADQRRGQRHAPRGRRGSGGPGSGPGCRAGRGQALPAGGDGGRGVQAGGGRQAGAPPAGRAGRPGRPMPESGGWPRNRRRLRRRRNGR